MRTSFHFLAVLTAVSLLGTGCPEDPINDRPTTETICDNSVDDDQDGDRDCDDSDCAADPACFVPCGDGTCDTTAGETLITCPVDCEALCGNGTCDATAGETLTTCPADCDSCGNGICDGDQGETASNCAADCDGSSCDKALPMILAGSGTYWEADGVLDPAGDRDYYSFTAEAGEWFQLVTDANPDDISGNVDTVISLFNADGSVTLAVKDDQAPRISMDTELFHRFVEGGTYCIRVWEWSDWANDTLVGGPTFTYNVSAFPVDFDALAWLTEDVEPNDSLATATPAVFELNTTIYFATIMGDFVGALEDDVDWYSFTSEAAAPALSIDFTPGEGTDDAYGSTADPALVEILEANGTTVIASLDVTMGSDGFSSVVLQPSTDYLIKVTAPNAGAGANPFYVLKTYQSDNLNPQETNDASNGVWTSAQAAAPQAPDDGTVSHFVGGTLDVSGGSDTDWWSFSAAVGDEISIACSSWRAGSGVRDAKFSLYGLDATAAVLHEQTETETTGVRWSAGTGASHAAIITSAAGVHYFKVSATTQDAGVTSNHYLCGIHVNTP